MERRGFDVILLTEMKIQFEEYSHNHLGYNVTWSAARPSSARGSHGGVGLVTRERPVEWGIESTCYHSQNVVSYNIVTGLTQTSLVGTCIRLSMLENMPNM